MPSYKRIVVVLKRRQGCYCLLTYLVVQYSMMKKSDTKAYYLLRSNCMIIVLTLYYLPIHIYVNISSSQVKTDVASVTFFSFR